MKIDENIIIKALSERDFHQKKRFTLQTDSNAKNKNMSQFVKKCKLLMKHEKFSSKHKDC